MCVVPPSCVSPRGWISPGAGIDAPGKEHTGTAPCAAPCKGAAAIVTVHQPLEPQCQDESLSCLLEDAQGGCSLSTFCYSSLFFFCHISHGCAGKGSHATVNGLWLMQIISDNLSQLLLGRHAPLVSKCHRKVFKSTLRRAGINRQGNTRLPEQPLQSWQALHTVCLHWPSPNCGWECTQIFTWDGSWRCHLNLSCPLLTPKAHPKNREASKATSAALYPQAQDGIALAGQTSLKVPPMPWWLFIPPAMSSLPLDALSGISAPPAWSCWGGFNSLTPQKSTTAIENSNFTPCPPLLPSDSQQDSPGSPSKAEPPVALGSLPPWVAALESAGDRRKQFQMWLKAYWSGWSGHLLGTQSAISSHHHPQPTAGALTFTWFSGIRLAIVNYCH